MKIYSEKVSDRKRVWVSGNHRTNGISISRTIGQLLEEAQNRNGVYGSNNEPVSNNMMVGELLDWHADYHWNLAE